MVSKLSLDRSVDVADLFVENHSVELGHHLARRELAKVATLFPGRAVGMLGCKLGEIGTGLDFIFEFPAGLFCIDQDVTCAEESCTC